MDTTLLKEVILFAVPIAFGALTALFKARGNTILFWTFAGITFGAFLLLGYNLLRPPYKVDVPGNQVWYNTNLQVKSGQKIIILASGEVFTENYNVPFSADGIYVGQGQEKTNPCKEVNASPCLLDGYPYGELVGKISDGAPFPVGSKMNMTVPSDGTLYLSMNDNYAYFNDNLGKFVVSVTLK